MAAKNSASEKALRDIIIQRMIQSPKAQALKTGSDTASIGNPGMEWQNIYSVFFSFEPFSIIFYPYEKKQTYRRSTWRCWYGGWWKWEWWRGRSANVAFGIVCITQTVQRMAVWRIWNSRFQNWQHHFTTRGHGCGQATKCARRTAETKSASRKCAWHASNYTSLHGNIKHQIDQSSKVKSI